MASSIIADLTKGSGRFNLTQGAISSAVRTGAFLSNIVGGFVAKHAGVNAALLMLACISLGGLAFFWFLMPETLADKAPKGKTFAVGA
jgi:MFS family permease